MLPSLILWLVDHLDAGATGRRIAMQSLAMLYAEQAIRLANERSIEHRRAALARRAAEHRGIAGAISDLAARLTTTAENSVTPALTDYPYRV
jgi:hypothetical protein